MKKTADLKRRVDKLPRIRLAKLPTPLEEMPNLSKLLGGPRLWIKRDDLTGIAFGGNKERKSEFFMDGVLVGDYAGESYGILTPEGVEAIKLIARTEGILLDPVYTGKAMAGLIDLVKKEHFKKDDNVVFVHTGGTPALFAYKTQLINRL